MTSVFRGALHRSGNALETESFKDSSAVVFKCLDFDGIVVLLGHRSHRSVSEPSVQRKPVPYKIPLKHSEFWRRGKSFKRVKVKYVAIISWREPPWQRGVTGVTKEPPTRRTITP